MPLFTCTYTVDVELQPDKKFTIPHLEPHCNTPSRMSSLTLVAYQLHNLKIIRKSLRIMISFFIHVPYVWGRWPSKLMPSARQFYSVNHKPAVNQCIISVCCHDDCLPATFNRGVAWRGEGEYSVISTRVQNRKPIKHSWIQLDGSTTRVDHNITVWPPLQ